MGRILTPVTIENCHTSGLRIQCDALVDTGAVYLTLPSAWKDRLGEFDSSESIDLPIDFDPADQSTLVGEICGPVKIQVEGFRAIFNEVLFVEMQPDDGQYEPLVGYLVLEQCQAAVDMLGHRLVQVKRMDLK